MIHTRPPFGEADDANQKLYKIQGEKKHRKIEIVRGCERDDVRFAIRALVFISVSVGCDANIAVVFIARRSDVGPLKRRRGYLNRDVHHVQRWRCVDVTGLVTAVWRIAREHSAQTCTTPTTDRSRPRDHDVTQERFGVVAPKICKVK